jgi:hypothetical protein
MVAHRMTPEKRALLRVVVTVNRGDSYRIRKTTLARLLGKPVYGVARTASVLAGAGYIEQSTGGSADEIWYRATDAGFEYYDEHLANPRVRRHPGGGGRPPAIPPEVFDRAREMLAERDGRGRRVHKQAAVAKRLGISVSALYFGLDPERRKARAKRRKVK